MAKKAEGFTLFEILVVLGILTITLLFAVPFTINQIEGNEVEGEAKKLKSSLFTQQQYAYTGKDDSTFGIKFSSGEYTLYEGDNYDSATLTEVINLPQGVQISQLSLENSADEIIFSQGNFRPNTNGSITLTDGSKTYRVSINSEGLLELTNL